MSINIDSKNIESPISTLPDELLLTVFGYLPDEALTIAAQVCTVWSRIVYGEINRAEDQHIRQSMVALLQESSVQQPAEDILQGDRQEIISYLLRDGDNMLQRLLIKQVRHAAIISGKIHLCKSFFLPLVRDDSDLVQAVTTAVLLGHQHIVRGLLHQLSPSYYLQETPPRIRELCIRVFYTTQPGESLALHGEIGESFNSMPMAQRQEGMWEARLLAHVKETKGYVFRPVLHRPSGDIALSQRDYFIWPATQEISIGPSIGPEEPILKC